MHDIILRDVSLSYGERQILPTLNHRFAAQQWHIIIGRSGMGKTSLLHAIANLLPPEAHMQGSITNQSGAPLHGHIAYMAQQNDLLPWLSLRENVLLAARLHRQNKDYARADALLAACGLSAHCDKRPQQLSGGQRQRVALARTLMQDCPYVLMDEPFSALDAITRYELQNLAAELLRDKTVLMITHDPAEALRLADSLHILNPQGLQAIALPPSPSPRSLDTQGLGILQEQLIQALRHD